MSGGGWIKLQSRRDGNREIALSVRTDFQERQIAGSERSDLLHGVTETVGNRSKVQQPGGEFTSAPAAESSEDGRIPHRSRHFRKPATFIASKSPRH